MTSIELLQNIQSQYKGLVLNQNWGETGLFYNPEGKLKKGIYLMTVKEKDGANDKSSDLNREGVLRLNLGISKPTFIKLFKEIPARPPAGGIVDMPFDFTALDTVMPHPVYGWMSWICVLNPSEKTLESMNPLIQEGYEMALIKYSKKLKTI